MGIVKRSVLTYHLSKYPQKLYVSLDIPIVKEPVKEELHLSDETIGQIPLQVTQYLDIICNEYHITRDTIDYALLTEQDRRSREEYYRGASLQKILEYESTGTKIATEVLLKLEKDEGAWRNDQELQEFIVSRLRGELGADYKWMTEAEHLAYNPLCVYRLDEDLRNPIGDRALRNIKSVLKQALLDKRRV
ncbi:MAG: hypothetical protein WED04_06755 [Promethearchaeati archaeon SRVP18_Atabeyarchaeia-1]